MAGQTYDTEAGRLEKFKGTILKRALSMEVLSRVGGQHTIPRRSSKTIVLKRFLPYGGVDNRFIAPGDDANFVNAHVISDGVTPTPDSVSSIDITAELEQIGCLYSYTDQFDEAHEDAGAYTDEMRSQISERIVLAKEMMDWGVLKTCTTQFFGGTGSTIDTVNGPLTAKIANQIVTTIRVNNGTFTKRLLASTPNYGTVAIPNGFVAYAHPEIETTLRGMEDAGFVPIEKYGNTRQVIDPEREIGALGSLRIIVAPQLTYIPDAGASAGSYTGSGTGRSDSGTDLNVYPIVVVGRGNSGGDPFAQIMLRGRESMKLTNKPVNQVDSGDPLGQRGYMGALTWHTSLIQNDGWMAVVWVAAADE